MSAAIAQEKAGSHYRHLAEVVRNNLENQQDWSQLRVHDGDEDDDDADRRPRILLSGLPPRRMYIHPDEQIEVLRAERALASNRDSSNNNDDDNNNSGRIPQPPEYEWVLPMHLAETPSVSQFAAVFDSIDALPPGASADGTSPEDSDGSGGGGGDGGGGAQWKQWRGPRWAKRLLLAIVQDDSSVVYYFMHDGIVKPRQN